MPVFINALLTNVIGGFKRIWCNNCDDDTHFFTTEMLANGTKQKNAVQDDIKAKV
ncbi:hypothetical protein [Psychrobacter alimentarius]|uniref:hypothetical protein n=1 Tax=Psychrobacter alimentarius TaxID=261164 RepID=UPI003FD62FED